MFEHLNTPEEIFSFKLGSARDKEKKLLDVLEELEQAAHREQIKVAVREHREETRQHAMNIERCFALLGEDIDDSPCPVIDAMAKEGNAIIKKNLDQDTHALRSRARR